MKYIIQPLNTCGNISSTLCKLNDKLNDKYIDIYHIKLVFLNVNTFVCTAVLKFICTAVRRMDTHENTGTDLDDKNYHSALTT